MKKFWSVALSLIIWFAMIALIFVFLLAVIQLMLELAKLVHNII